MPSRGWREYPQRYRREAGKCKGCGKIFFPPRLVCDKCAAREFEGVVLPETGKLVTHTIIRTPSSRFSDQAPYALGIVELEGGVRVMLQLADIDFDDLVIGLPLKLEFRKLFSEASAGVIHYGHKAVPLR